jgi:uncharacterized protein YbcI
MTSGPLPFNGRLATDSEPFENSIRRADLNGSSVDGEPPFQPQNHGEALTAISDGPVALLKEFYGRGPTRAKSYSEDDLVVCVLRGGFSCVEQTLLDGGRGEAVINQRMEFQEVMRERFEAVIEAATGQRVIGFVSGNQQARAGGGSATVALPAGVCTHVAFPMGSSVVTFECNLVCPEGDEHDPPRRRDSDGPRAHICCCSTF